MAMSKRTRTILIVIAVAVAAYLVYRWWQNRQDSGQANTTGTGLGSNLNSLAPEMVAGSAGPASGVDYTPGNSAVTIDLPGGGPSQDIGGNDQSSDEDNDDGRPKPRPLPCPGGAHWDPVKKKCIFGTGEGPIPKPKPKPKPRHKPPKRRRVPPTPVGPVSH